MNTCACENNLTKLFYIGTIILGAFSPTSSGHVQKAASQGGHGMVDGASMFGTLAA